MTCQQKYISVHYSDDVFIFDRLGSISILKWNEIIGPTLIQDNKTGHKYDDAKPWGTT